MCHSKLKKSKKKGGYNIDDDNVNNRINTQNITPAIDIDGYLIWKHINIGTIVITPNNGCIWEIVNYTVNTSVEGIQYNTFTLKCIIGCIVNTEIITTSYDFRVLVVFKQNEKSYNLGLITGYNHSEISFNVTTKDDDNNIYNWSFNNTETVKSNIIGVIKSDDLINNLVMQDGLSELHRKYLAMKDMKAGKELINLRTIYNNNFQSSNISSYADIAKQKGLGINFGRPLFIGSLGAIGNQSAFGPPQSTAFSPPSAAFGSPSAAFGSPSAAFGSPSAAFGSPRAAFGSPSAAFGSPRAAFAPDNDVKMANMILNIYLELLANEAIYDAILSDNKAGNITKRNIIIETLKENLKFKANSNKILTKEYYNTKVSDISRLSKILFYLFDITDINEAIEKIIHLEDTIIPALDDLRKKGGFILFLTVKRVYELDDNIYKSDDFFDGYNMLNRLFLSLKKLNESRPRGSPPLRFGPGGGGLPVYKNIGNKEILGKNRIIFKTAGSNKEYIKNKGMFIPVSEYKKQQKHK